MRMEKVPVDVSSEQKVILGIISKRQMFYLFIGGILLYSYVPKVFSFSNMYFGFVSALVISLITALPVLVIVLLLGFTQVSKHYMNRDQYFLVKFGRKTQYGSWRKGS